jgi:Spy/CpxP family protein refolding chaperone
MWPFKTKQNPVVATPKKEDEATRTYRLNRRSDIVMRYLQRITLQNFYINYLKKACDHWEWEHDKKVAELELKNKELKELKEAFGRMQHDRDRARHEFKEYLQKAKKAKENSEKVENQRLKIIELTTKLEETEKRLKVRNQMVELLERQQRRKT